MSVGRDCKEVISVRPYLEDQVFKPTFPSQYNDSSCDQEKKARLFIVHDDRLIFFHNFFLSKYCVLHIHKRFDLESLLSRSTISQVAQSCTRTEAEPVVTAHRVLQYDAQSNVYMFDRQVKQISAVIFMETLIIR